MRGLGNFAKGAVFLAGLLGLSASALAQQDPKISVYFDEATTCPVGYSFNYDPSSPKCVSTSLTPAQKSGNQLTTVTLSRLPKFPSYAAYDLAITNTSTNTLNRLYFTITASNNGTDAAQFSLDDVLYVPTNSTDAKFDCSVSNNKTAKTSTLTCTSGGTTSPNTAVNLDPVVNPTQSVTIFVRTPTTGTTLTVTASAGGYEGTSLGGKGCCALTRSTPTTLDDWTNDVQLTYLKKAQTYVRSGGGTFFTGAGAIPSDSDLLSTEVIASAFQSANYDIGQIFEDQVTCKSSGRFKNCYKTQVSLPLVDYTPGSTPDPDPSTVCRDSAAKLRTDNLLTVVLRIDRSNLVNPNNIDLTAIKINYTDDKIAPTNTYPFPYCAPGSGSPCTVPACAAGSGFPCLCSLHQYKQNTSGGLLDYSPSLRLDIEAVIKNTGNGLLEFD